MTLNEAIQKRILELCYERDISINKLCLQSGVTQSTVNNILSRKNTTPTILTIKRLCDGAEISLTEFFDSTLFDNLDSSL